MMYKIEKGVYHMNIIFEKASRKDVPIILQFIKDLARYEKLENEVMQHKN